MEGTVSELGRFLILAGVILVGLGLLLTFAGKLPWLGRLPGDIYYKTDHVTIYFPLMTSLILSVALTLLIYLFRR
ncbi:MAG: hypothetical protein KatS3mg077_1620 [Candidatus Binatia bacterium]|nr:MAG: hypothetical protein KatS3mg077_1620 [Candidatus Binatia bacterium]